MHQYNVFYSIIYNVGIKGDTLDTRIIYT